MKTILITGVAGLLGNNLLRHLLTKNYNIIGVDNLFGGYKEFLPQNNRFKFYEYDLMDSEKISNLFNDSVLCLCIVCFLTIQIHYSGIFTEPSNKNQGQLTAKALEF